MAHRPVPQPSLYQADLAAGRITRDEAREYLAEIFLKLRGQFFALGGRLRDGSDANQRRQLDLYGSVRHDRRL
jgi:hypothetical protein